MKKSVVKRAIFSNIEIVNLLPTGHKIGDPQPLFTKIEPELIEEYRKKFAGSQESRKSPPKEVKVPQCNGDVGTLEEAIAKQVSQLLSLIIIILVLIFACIVFKFCIFKLRFFLNEI